MLLMILCTLTGALKNDKLYMGKLNSTEFTSVTLPPIDRRLPFHVASLLLSCCITEFHASILLGLQPTKIPTKFKRNHILSAPQEYRCHLHKLIFDSFPIQLAF